MFGTVLKTTTERHIQPGRALDLLPPAPLPDDMYWAEPNPRIASALSRWAGVVERESALVVQPHIRNLFITICNAGRVNRCPSAEVGWIRRLRV